MISNNWKTSERKYSVIVERDIKVPVSDGTKLNADIFRPDGQGKFPAILTVHSYNQSMQSAPIMPVAIGLGVATLEAGDPNFYVRRGYVFIILSVRGIGKSEGKYQHYSPLEVKDTYDAIEWIARQQWCDGNIGMAGVSYFAVAAKQVAALNPPHLKAIFSPFGYTDFYRDKIYHGGILAYGFLQHWVTGSLRNATGGYNWSKEKLGKEGYEKAIASALQDRDVTAIPYLAEVLRKPEDKLNSLVVDILLNFLDGPYYHERDIDYTNLKIPTYTGACWGAISSHLPGAFRDWENLKGPKKMTIGPPIYLDRPVYQYQYESLRWFDHWLKGVDTGIMQEPLVRLFVMGAEEWKETSNWPLPNTKWTPFYLHANGLLSEHEFWPNEGHSNLFDSVYAHGSLTFTSPPMVENTEVIGPIVLNLYASTVDTEILWFVSLLDVDSEGHQKLLTKGWLRGTLRGVDSTRSKPWQPFHPFNKPEPISPNEIYEFNIDLVPTGNLFKNGHRIAIKVKCADDDTELAPNWLVRNAYGHVWRQVGSSVSVYHNADYPSHLLLPITRGNIIGTYMSGGKLP